MPTTTSGYPYPNGTDPVTQGDDAIKALADALQLRRLTFVHGTAGGGTLGAGGGTVAYVPATAVPPSTAPRTAVVFWSGMCTTVAATDTGFNLRETTAANATRRIARVPTANLVAVGYWVQTIAANAAISFDVVLSGSGAATATADGRLSGLDIVLLGN